MKFAAIVALCLLAGCSSPKPLPVMGQVPVFTLTAGKRRGIRQHVR